MNNNDLNTNDRLLMRHLSFALLKRRRYAQDHQYRFGKKKRTKGGAGPHFSSHTKSAKSYYYKLFVLSLLCFGAPRAHDSVVYSTLFVCLFVCLKERGIVSETHHRHHHHHHHQIIKSSCRGRKNLLNREANPPWRKL